jgi:transcriptional regulator with GAF, ATPase, and Fis domain
VILSVNKFLFNRFALLSLGACAVVYSTCVLIYVSSTYEVGIGSILTPNIIGRPLSAKGGENDQIPASGDLITRLGSEQIHTWSDLLDAPGKLHEQIASGTSASWYRPDRATGQDFVTGKFKRIDDPDQIEHTFECELRRFPLQEMVPSLIWLLLKGSLFVIGALVYWKRPDDEAAVRFYILCVITLCAYVGGYHWTHIVTQPVLQIVFMACAVLLPVANLHFYLVFPRKKTWLELYPRRILGVIYGIPLTNLLCLIGFYLYIRWLPDSLLRQFLPGLIYSSFGVAMVWYLACMLSLFHSMRTVADAMERKQVKCILIGVFFSLIPISVSLHIVLLEPEKFAEGAATWPMFGASLIVTVAYAIGMTRYKLMALEKIINSSVGYFLVSFLAGAMYYGVVFIGTLFYSSFISSPTLPAALTVSTTALIFVLALDAARSRVQRALDRRFSRGKSQIDQTLRQMSQAISQLVDPPVLAQRLLSTVSDALAIPRGAIYLRHGEPPDFRLVATQGEVPAVASLEPDAPFIEALRTGLRLECPSTSEGALTAAQRQLRQLGGEIAQPLLSEGALMAAMILGPKDTPYRPEDWNLLSAFAQIAIVALESAAQHRTIEHLNQDLQTKVDKIAEQQQRILALQTQLTRKSAVEQSAKKPESRPVLARLEPTGAPAARAGGIVGSSPVVLQLLSLVRKVAATDAVVLLRGESGTGKELLARAVHDNSTRAGEPYIKVHCAALSANLLESELFGHVKGAFTGAHRDKVGRFELANRGTLFLDEIGDINLETQTKLLRVLQEKTIERVGSSDSLRVDVRIVAATHQNLEALIRQGRFREDLFYRLNVFPIQVPSLRERAEDIPELAMFFIQQSSRRCRKNILQIDDDALALLKAFPWPGNIRQLENVIERAVVIAEGDVLTLRDMPAELFQGVSDWNGERQPVQQPIEVDAAAVPSFRGDRDRFERAQLMRALADAGGNKAEAARILGIARSTLVSRLKKLGLIND